MRLIATRRLRALVVAGAMAVGMIAGPAAFADDVPPDHARDATGHAPGLKMDVEARDGADKAPWDHDDGGITTQGWSWL